MSTDVGTVSRFQTLEATACEDILFVLKMVYGDGYLNNRISYQERKDLRAKSYRALRVLGAEK